MLTNTAVATSPIAILRMAFPIILANAAVPLLGLVDTGVIGHTGNATALGGIALGSLVFSFVYWGFGFLRMGTSGFTAQAAGAGDNLEVRAAFARALFLGIGIGLVLILAQYPIGKFALWLLDGSTAVEQQLKQYWDFRIWGAPATLGTYAIVGTLIGLGHTRKLLWLQLLLNGTNLFLDGLLVLVFDWGVRGIAIGTVIAEWCSFTLGMWMILKLLKPHAKESFWPWHRLIKRDALFNTLRTNIDILWRTLFLLAGFGWFTNQGALFGDTTLAANHILLQFISLSAFFLDGFAFALESLVGQSIGLRNRQLFDRVVIVCTRISAITALGLMLLMYFTGYIAIAMLTEIPSIQQEAEKYLPFAAIYILVSFAAYQLDGIFIGATRSREMRNASLLSLLVFLVLAWFLTSLYGNSGLWLAFIGYVIARSLSLGFYLPGLRRYLADERQ